MLSLKPYFDNAGKTTALHGLFGANDEVFGVAKNMWYKNPDKAMVWSVIATGIALSTTYSKKLAIAAAFLDPFVSRACTAHKKKIANAIPPELKRNRLIGTMVAGTSAIAAGKILVDAHSKKPKRLKKYSSPSPQRSNIRT